MNKAVKEARSFLNKSVQGNDFVEGFQAPRTIAPTIAIPITIELTEQEKLGIYKILTEEYAPESISEIQSIQNVEQLTSITQQIKSIATQSVLLHGERILQAQEILKEYKDGAFTRWLMNTYGNRQTPYSMLRYYEFYQSAPAEARGLIESAPKKCVYLLASRAGSETKKIDLIKCHGDKTQAKFLQEIQTAFPTQEKDRRRPLSGTTLAAMGNLCDKLERNAKNLSKSDRESIEKLIVRLQKL